MSRKKMMIDQITKLDRMVGERDAKINQLNYELEAAQYRLKALDKIERCVKLHHASNVAVNEAPTVCLSMDAEFSMNFYPDDEWARGVLIFEGSQLVGAFGEIPAKVVMDEINYYKR